MLYCGRKEKAQSHPILNSLVPVLFKLAASLVATLAQRDYLVYFTWDTEKL